MGDNPKINLLWVNLRLFEKEEGENDVKIVFKFYEAFNHFKNDRLANK